MRFSFFLMAGTFELMVSRIGPKCKIGQFHDTIKSTVAATGMEKMEIAKSEPDQGLVKSHGPPIKTGEQSL